MSFLPRSVQEALDIASAHKEGIFEIEKNSEKGDKPRKFDRVYEFTDVNYVDQDEKKQNTVCLLWCKFLNSMTVDFKITIVSEPRNAAAYEANLEVAREMHCAVFTPSSIGVFLQDTENSKYPKLAEYNNRLIPQA